MRPGASDSAGLPPRAEERALPKSMNVPRRPSQRSEDRLYGGPGMLGGPGNDRIEAADGQHDLIDCGPGKFDRVSVDD